VEAGQALSGAWSAAADDQDRYDLSVYGPNGFLRTFRGTASPAAQANLEVDCRYDAGRYDIVLVVTNRGAVACEVTTRNLYGMDSASRVLEPGRRFRSRWALESSFGWYDFVIEASTDQDFLRRLAGHLENGQGSSSDPAIGGAGRVRAGVQSPAMIEE
jgi:phospholipase C